MIVVKGMAIGTKIVVDLGTKMEGIEAAPGRVPNPGAVPRIDTRIEGKVETTKEMGTGLSLDLDPGAVPRIDTRIEGKVETTKEMGTGLSLDLDPLLM